MLSTVEPDPFAAVSDADLVTLTLERGSRDNRPFQELFRRHNTMIWRLCYRYFHNARDAEDMMQDIFFKAYRNLARFEGRSAFKTWIYRIAINTCQNELRRRSRRPQESQTELETAAAFIPAAQTVESAQRLSALNDLLIATMASLRPTERQVLVLKDVEERPYAEVAELLDISLSAAKMRVQRARLAFQHEFERLGGEYRPAK